MPNFDDIADKVLETVERPPLAPLGDYVFQVLKLPERREVSSDKGAWDALEFSLRGVRPTEGVDPDLFKAFGDAKNILVRKTFMFTKDQDDKAGFETTQANLRDFLVKHLGLDASMSIKEGINASVGKQCIGTLKYRADRDDPSTMFHDLGRTAPLA
jgi:hypothetical protein